MRLKECTEELKSLLAEEDLKNVPLLVYANKQDIELALDAPEVMDTLELNSITDRTWNL